MPYFQKAVCQTGIYIYICLYTMRNFFPCHFKSKQIWSVITLFRLAWHQTKASHSPPTLSITTPSPPSQIYITDPPLHLTLTSHDTFFLTKCCCRLIFKPSYPLLLISYTLFTFPSASCWTFLL